MRGQINIQLIVIILLVGILCIFLGRSLAASGSFDSVGLLIVLGACAATLINVDWGIIILLFSMLLSPEIPLVNLPERAVVVRFDDLLLVAVFFSWMARMAIDKQLGLFKRTPLNLPIIAYVAVCVLSTAIGILGRDIRPFESFFYLLKYIEYFMLYFMITNTIRNKRQVKVFIAVMLITCALTCGYAILTIGQIGSSVGEIRSVAQATAIATGEMPVASEEMARATAPFEGRFGEPNTLGGYLILLFALTLAFFLYSPSAIWRFFCAALAMLIFATLLLTLSRSSYLAFIPMYLTIVILTRKKKALLVAILILGIFIFPFLTPERVVKRISAPFIEESDYEYLGGLVALDASAASRIENWKYILTIWQRRPFLGYGITGVGLVDTQYPRVLGELGLAGIAVFIWLIRRIFIYSLRSLRNAEDEWSQGLVLGFFAGFIGLLTHAFGANTFIIVRIMEPFWFLAAVVIMLPHISKNEALKLETT